MCNCLTALNMLPDVPLIDRLHPDGCARGNVAPESRVQRVGSVGCSDYNYVRVRAEVAASGLTFVHTSPSRPFLRRALPVPACSLPLLLVVWGGGGRRHVVHAREHLSNDPAE